MRIQKHGFWYHLLDIVFNIVVIVAIVAGIRTFLVSPFQVEGSSMIDTLVDREYIIINKLTYFISTPERGDVVVFRPPNDPSKYYVKRVIGLPGDTVTIKEGFVYVKELNQPTAKKLDETSYLNTHNLGSTYRHPPSSGDKTPISYTVPADEYFVLGDNRQGSLDSRSFTSENGKSIPFVQRDEIKGKVWFVALPITKIHAIAEPSYGS